MRHHKFLESFRSLRKEKVIQHVTKRSWSSDEGRKIRLIFLGNFFFFIFFLSVYAFFTCSGRNTTLTRASFREPMFCKL